MIKNKMAMTNVVLLLKIERGVGRQPIEYRRMSSSFLAQERGTVYHCMSGPVVVRRVNSTQLNYVRGPQAGQRRHREPGGRGRKWSLRRTGRGRTHAMSVPGTRRELS